MYGFFYGFFKKIKKATNLNLISTLPVVHISEKTIFSNDTVRRNKDNKKILAKQRIGPHQEEVVSTLVGSLLGDGYAEKRSNVTRIHIHMSSRNVSYIHFLHRFF